MPPLFQAQFSVSESFAGWETSLSRVCQFGPPARLPVRFSIRRGGPLSLSGPSALSKLFVFATEGVTAHTFSPASYSSVPSNLCQKRQTNCYT
ncbi:hypothetical protein DIPPA_58031, partial [Diplonema papillatum]